ncbi:unnamed protein product [Clonostachys rosea]|uniref:ARCA protein n=1 Tax=Bionectria ochroleuca TaxID=29856 RepID=A0ABY6U555_BIOOC|nr:unnamed protein product [Clonostachys rosea]
MKFRVSQSTDNSKAPEFSYSPDQQWCDPSSSLIFCDEGPDLESRYEIESTAEYGDSISKAPRVNGEERQFSDSDSAVVLGAACDNVEEVQQQLDSQLQFPHSTDSYHHHGDHYGEVGAVELPSIASITDGFLPHSQFLSSEPQSILLGIANSLDDKISPRQPNEELSNEQDALHHFSLDVDDLQLYYETPIWPLREEAEAELVRFFVENVARHFDMCDPERHFAFIVPQRAALCPPLMNAVLAISARHFKNADSSSQYVSDGYYQKSLNTLVPMLNDSESLSDENLFAAIVLLRSLEEREVPLSSADTRTHLLGGHLFVKATNAICSVASPGNIFSVTSLTGLRRAAFHVAIRQEIYTAFASQRPVTLDFTFPDVDYSLESPGDDCTWTNRIFIHAVGALNYCFGDDGTAGMDKSLETYDALVAYAEQWYEKKPPSFTPIFYKHHQRSGLEGRRISPDIWLLSDTVTTGLLNYHLVRILLFAFDPRTPRIGPSKARFLQTQKENVQNEVKQLLGIAYGNPNCAPHHILACTGVSMAGDQFENLWEQEELMRFLKQTEEKHTWCTSKARRHLAEAWGWSTFEE